MGKSLTYKILEQHLVEGTLAAGQEVAIRIDQTLTQDATGTTAFLLFESMGVARVRNELAVSYVDHNMAMFGPENHTDHLYLQTIAPKVGAYHSRPGNGICHQVHLERFAVPGKTLLGSDSHTPTAGGAGMLAIGAGGLDVAVAMGGGAFYMTVPKVIGVELKGRLRPWVAPKDIIFRVLSILTTKGNVDGVIEYFGEGVKGLAVPDRSTITNMGAELGVTTSVFPSDAMTKKYLKAQGRDDQYKAIGPDRSARYDRITKQLHAEKDAAAIENIRKYCLGVEVTAADANGYATVSFDRIVIDLSELEPLLAAPGSPDNIQTVRQCAGTKVHQVIVGSCTNSSFHDLMVVAKVLEGRTIHPSVEFSVTPGSRQVFNMIARNGALASLIAAGAKILESACGPCIGQGQSPAEGTVSVRSFNRNFAGRSGTFNDKVYLASPETCAAAAITGELTDPRDLARLSMEYPKIPWPTRFIVDDSLILKPMAEAEAASAEVFRGPTIVTPPAAEVPPADLAGPVLIKVGDKVSTDAIIPAGSFLKHRSNVPEYAKYVFHFLNKPGRPTFAERGLAAKQAGKHGVVVAADSYGQGSSREHAALCPMYLGVRAVIARSMERIHKANLVNFAIVPMLFVDPRDYEKVEEGDELAVPGLLKAIESGTARVSVQNRAKGTAFECSLPLSDRERRILAAGGKLNHTRLAGVAAH
jgi:aconitate hydratase